jgi:hypothetical protein
MNAVSGDTFEERPVDLEEFMYGFDYLDLSNQGNVKVRASDEQMDLIRASTQIFTEETLIELWGEEEGRRRYKMTYNEVICMLGKGSGKDWLSTVACAYIVYQLMCLTDPAAYYGKGHGDSIDILNVAINAQQAQRVFFDNFVIKIKHSPWFRGKFDPKASQINFDKNINVYSGHSEREAFEGLNLFYCVLDEISGFALDSPSGSATAKTAEGIYLMYKQSVKSRFAKFGKLVLLSFPRFKNDFISSRYNDVVIDKETIKMSRTLKLNDDLPDGVAENEFTIEWDHDVNLVYKISGVFARKRATWEVNPSTELEDLKQAFYDDMPDSMMRFACMPPDSIAGFFKDHEKVDAALSSSNGVDNETGTFMAAFQPDPTKTYYIHVDLAMKHDRCAVAMSHVEGRVRAELGSGMQENRPVVKVDALRWWQPRKDKQVDFTEVRDYIVSLRQRGFNIRLVTFDRWHSEDMIKYLNNINIRAEVLSVAIRHYTDLLGLVQDGRLVAPREPALRQEMVELRLLDNGKVDHPRNGFKDITDAMCGSCYNSVAHTPMNVFDSIEVLTMDSLREELAKPEPEEDNEFHGVIKPQRSRTQSEIPMDIQDFIDGMRTI